MMTVKELFQKTNYEDVWKEYVKIEDLDEEKYPYDKEGRKRVFDFVKDYKGKKAEKHIIVCINDCVNFLAVSGFYFDADLPCNIEEMVKDDLWEIKTYGLECSEFYEWCDWEVFDLSIKTYGEVICAAYILYEMTYHGTTEEVRKERLKDIFD